MDSDTKLVQDFLDKHGLIIQQGDITVKTVNDGSLLLTKPIVTVGKKPSVEEEVTEGEIVPDGSK